MARVCILTDSTVQFTQTNFPGRERVHIIPFVSPKSIHPADAPTSGEICFPEEKLIPPGCQEFIQSFTHLGEHYDSILVITNSANLSSCMSNAKRAARIFSNHAVVDLVDSQLVSIGLGFVVQEAAGMACSGESVGNIVKHLRHVIPNIYMIISIPELSRLAHNGYISQAQGVVGEMIGMLPVFSLEEGCLVPMDKARNERHLFDTFQDFLSEFNSPEHISLIRGDGHRDARVRLFRTFVGNMFPETPFSEHSIQPAMLELFGEGSTGLVIMEKTRAGE